jgi:hypothetical protein
MSELINHNVSDQWRNKLANDYNSFYGKTAIEVQHKLRRDGYNAQIVEYSTRKRNDPGNRLLFGSKGSYICELGNTIPQIKVVLCKSEANGQLFILLGIKE